MPCFRYSSEIITDLFYFGINTMGNFKDFAQNGVLYKISYVSQSY